MKATDLEANQGWRKAVMEPHKWAPRIKATHLLTTLQNQDSNVLQGGPKGVTREKTIGATEDQFGDQ
jgi:hypothetical protein